MSAATSTSLAVAAAVASATATYMYLSSTGSGSAHDTRLRLNKLQEALASLEQGTSIEATTDTSNTWLASLQAVMPAIVTIRVMAVRAFDGENPTYMVATGFIVDRTRGLILTNRHVVTPGPVVADAVFVNHEEVALVPIYRDPVHDFGFFRFDPSSVRFQTQLPEIPLRPDLAQVGTPIRVVGNDNAEKVQILPGILAKLDRAAPQYGLTGYNDFNTFYYAAASSTSGGSSGSPVLNAQGMAIALNAGGATNAASSYYLPLDRVVRALELLQQGQAVTRGTWQTIFRHVPFDEARQLGLTTEVEQAIRAKNPSELGVLVVDQVLPDGPADGVLDVGDILLEINGKYCTAFLTLETILDDSIDQPLYVTFQRGSASPVDAYLTVQDLHAISPSRFLEVGHCVIHELSYQQARNMALPAGGVYVAAPGHMLFKADIFESCLIVSVNGSPTPSLDTFVDVLQTLPDGSRVSLQYFFSVNRHQVETAVITIDRHWGPMQMYTRNDADGLWHPKVLPFLPATDSVEAALPRHPSMAPSDQDDRLAAVSTGHLEGSVNVKNPVVEAVPSTGTTRLQGENDVTTTHLSSLVFVRFDTHLTIDGMSTSCYDGVGYVLNADLGYVLVDKFTVPVSLGDVTVTIAGSLQVPATIRYVHPIHNATIIQYNPADVPPGLVSNIHIAATAVPADCLRVGASLPFIGLSRNWTVVTASTVVSKIERLPVVDFNVPRHKGSSCQVELMSLDQQIAAGRGGVFTDPKDPTVVVALYLAFEDEELADGRVQAFAFGVPMFWLQDLVHRCQQSEVHLPPTVAWLPVDFGTLGLADARAGYHLAPEMLSALEQSTDDTRQVLTVQKCMAGTQASDQLRSGDFVLAIDGQVVAKSSDVVRSCTGKSTVDVTVWRDRTAVVVPVAMCDLSTRGTDRVVLWSGLMLHAPHVAVLQRGFNGSETSGVYVSHRSRGSPADKAGLLQSQYIVQVNDEATPTLDAFLAVVTSIPRGAFIRLRLVDLNTRQTMATIKPDSHYWPTTVLSFDGYKWTVSEASS